MSVTLHLIASCREAFRRLYGISNEAEDISPTGFTDDFLALARRHRVINLLEAGLGLSRVLPTEQAVRWQQAVFGQARHTSARVSEAERLFKFLEDALTRPVLIKGPALAAQAWPDLSLRVFDDLDFRVARGEYDQLIEVMTASGYRPLTDDPRRRYALWHFGWGIGFRNGEGSIVEFNHRFFPPHFPVPGGFHPAREEFITTIKLDEQSVCTLTPAVHLQYACLHAAWHGWERLAWLIDIGGLLIRHPEALEEARAQSIRHGFARVSLRQGVSLASELLGLAYASGTANLKEILEQAPAERHGANLRKQHRSGMNFIEKTGYDLRRVLTPGDGDFAGLPLPRKALFLYWPIRPIRFMVSRINRPAVTQIT
ncbi:MAG: nucleotidyltransferase domain-containing protein [Kiritimatiellia bacterium]